MVFIARPFVLGVLGPVRCRCQVWDDLESVEVEFANRISYGLQVLKTVYL